MKPKKCCAMGSYKHQIPMPINGKVRGIDFCIADIVAALNAGGITTTGSCCGHHKILGSVCLEDGRNLIIVDNKIFHKIIGENKNV